jgi:hypothetical protein
MLIFIRKSIAIFLNGAFLYDILTGSQKNDSEASFNCYLALMVAGLSIIFTFLFLFNKRQYSIFKFEERYVIINPRS